MANKPDIRFIRCGLHLLSFNGKLVWELMITEGKKQKRQSFVMTLPFPPILLELVLKLPPEAYKTK
jgi:hypothetical protein